MIKFLRSILCKNKELPRSKLSLGADIIKRLDDQNLWRSGQRGNPVDDIGIALQMARKYGVEIGPGLSYDVCRAYLPASRWRGVPTVSYVPAGDWIERHDVCEAICMCVLSCRNIGIL